MIILLAGASHTGKTNYAQRLLEAYGYPYQSIDHLKMGCIRSGYTSLRVEDDEGISAYLWPILKEMIKTAIENDQNMMIEGCYIPFDWKESFTNTYLEKIHYVCLIMSKEYIQLNVDNIRKYANIVEKRIHDDVEIEVLIEENDRNLRLCKEYGLFYHLITDTYDIPLDIVNVM